MLTNDKQVVVYIVPVFVDELGATGNCYAVLPRPQAELDKPVLLSALPESVGLTGSSGSLPPFQVTFTSSHFTLQLSIYLNTAS
jgi:hypothetical protein